MPTSRKVFAIPPNIEFGFNPRLAPQEQADAKSCYWLQKHLEKLSKKYPAASIQINSIDYFPDRNISSIGISGTYTHPDRSQGSSTYSVVPDGVNVLLAFKLVGMDLSGRKLHNKQKVTYAVLTAREPRMAWSDLNALGLVGGFCNQREMKARTARREVLEETHMRIPSGTKIHKLREFNVRGGSTQKSTNMGAYISLHVEQFADREFVRNLRSRQGGLIDEGERIHMQLMSFEKFLSAPSLRQRYSPDLYELAQKTALAGDKGPLEAYDVAERTYQKKRQPRSRLFQVLKTAHA